MPCAHGLFPPTLSALVHAHGVQELSLSLANGRWVFLFCKLVCVVGVGLIESISSVHRQGQPTKNHTPSNPHRWERNLWGDPTFPSTRNTTDAAASSTTSSSPFQHHQHHTEPPYGAEVWARLLLPTAAAAATPNNASSSAAIAASTDADGQAHWRQLLEGLGALYHFPLRLAASSTHADADGIAAANVIGGGGGGRVRPAASSAFRLSLPLAARGGYRLLPPSASAAAAAAATKAPRLRYAHLPAPAGLCGDALHRTLLGAGPSLLSPCRGITTTEAGGGGSVGALLALGLWGGGEGSAPPLLAADYLGYALELRRVCLEGEEDR